MHGYFKQETACSTPVHCVAKYQECIADACDVGMFSSLIKEKLCLIQEDM